MDMERRGFFVKALAAGAGAMALFRGVKARAKGLPSDPDAKRSGAGGPDEIQLPLFDKDSEFTLDQALLARKTDRNYDEDKTLSLEELSRILWAADGVNRPDGHRTVPSAMARYPVDVYAALPEGVFLYDLKKHKLLKAADGDIRSQIPAVQGDLRKAAMSLLYVFNKGLITGGDKGWAELEIGGMVQNVYLMAAALNLGSCVYALVRYDKVPGLIGLKRNQELIIAQTVGPLK